VTPSPPARVIAYLRSAPEPEDDQVELAEQRRRIEECVAKHGWTVAAEHFDHQWGSLALAERDEGRRLLADLRPNDLVIATALDRLCADYADSVATIETFKARGARLYLLDLDAEVTDSQTGEIAKRILAAFAGG
jgi:DNA invertase Pin-like site-specific DNA recombinase